MKYLSLFSGVEAASLAWEPLGWEPVAFCEFDAFPSAVLAHHWPQVPNFGDVTKITERQIKKLGHIDLVVFGSPCQDLSVAGKGEGLNGERSGLFRDAIRIIKWCRKHCGTRFALWENVPGAFSSNRGSDFAEVINLLSGTKFTCEKWQTSGVAIGNKGLVEWATLDAQYFGVPQRRRRVFALADFGDWRGRSQILFESQSMSGDFEASSKEKENTTPKIAGNVRAPSHWDSDRAPHPTLNQSHNTGGIAQSNQELFSQRGAGLVPVEVFNESGFGKWKFGFGTIRQSGGHVGGGSENLAVCIPIHDKATRFSGKTGRGSGNGLGIGSNGEPSPTLTTGDKHSVFCEEKAYCLQTTCNDYSRADGFNMVSQRNVARKLTPVECERLQGMPDNHTQIPWGNNPLKECPDGHRYKAIGNSMAVPVMRWIGQRIDLVINHDASAA